MGTGNYSACRSISGICVKAIYFFTAGKKIFAWKNLLNHIFANLTIKYSNANPFCMPDYGLDIVRLLSNRFTSTWAAKPPGIVAKLAAVFYSPIAQQQTLVR